MKTLIGPALLVMLLIPLPGLGQTSTAVDTAIDKLLHKGLWEEAVAELQVLFRAPQTPRQERIRAGIHLGIGHVFLGQEEASVEAFTQLIGFAPQVTVDDLELEGNRASARTVHCFGQAIAMTEARPATYTRQLERAATLLTEDEAPKAAMVELQRLLASEHFPAADEARARRFLAMSYSAQGLEQEAVAVFKTIVRDDRYFGMDQIAVPGVPQTQTVRYLGEALMTVRQEEHDALFQRLKATTTQGALLRSLVLPGWGQLYQGYRSRGYALMGLSAASVAMAIWQDNAFRDARGAYRTAAAGADFTRLYQHCSDKADHADLALGLVGALWALNAIDAGMQGANLVRPKVTLLPDTETGGVRLACVRRF